MAHNAWCDLHVTIPPVRLLAQFVPEHLAGQVLGQFGAELDAFRRLEAGNGGAPEKRPCPLQQLLGGRGLALVGVCRDEDQGR